MWSTKQEAHSLLVEKLKHSPRILTPTNCINCQTGVGVGWRDLFTYLLVRKGESVYLSTEEGGNLLIHSYTLHHSMYDYTTGSRALSKAINSNCKLAQRRGI